MDTKRIGVLFLSMMAVTFAGQAMAAPAMKLYDAPWPVLSFRFTDATRHTLSLADFGGRVLLLNLWATWCIPCRKEMPSLDRLQARLGGPAFHVLALSQDKAGDDAVKRFFRNVGIHHLRRYVDSTGRSANVLGVFVIPTTLLIDWEGREIGRYVGAADWDSPAVIALIRRVVDAPYPTRDPGTENGLRYE
ncbi:TlpA family protein disulfide reductase [Salinisphaera hydrothermalis]|uniref:Redoxin domain-containing protein n=1 Tax=Salinisphaera hydrothermalis (strain C41B8) TaxID=1304275 RepID=A0A084IGD6_SALHC|nr:TlpA disulfide reductase family protein [Salinisphaera hydrothermalis]KEZ75770.1 redoxin domain-containing protein [Salinisphaera hydrothermalis C41B8]